MSSIIAVAIDSKTLAPIIEIASPHEKSGDIHSLQATQTFKTGYPWMKNNTSNPIDTGTESEEIELPNFSYGKHKPNKKLHKHASLDSKTQQFRRKMVRGRSSKVGVLPDTPVSNTHHTVSNLFHTNSSGSQNLSQHHNDELLNKFSKEELEEFHQLFSMFDTDGSGAIGSEELKEAIMSIGLQANDTEIDNLIKEVDEDGNGEIDFAEFCHCMKKSQNLAKNSNEEIIRQCFKIFDQDGNGMITENEFKYVAKEIGGFSDDLAEHVFHELDISSNGHLSADQFAAIVEDYLLTDHLRY